MNSHAQLVWFQPNRKTTQVYYWLFLLVWSNGEDRNGTSKNGFHHNGLAGRILRPASG